MKEKTREREKEKQREKEGDRQTEISSRICIINKVRSLVRCSESFRVAASAARNQAVQASFDGEGRGEEGRGGEERCHPAEEDAHNARGEGGA